MKEVERDVPGIQYFLTRGSLIETAVGLVMALAFFAVVESLVTHLLTPLIAAIFGEPDFPALAFTVNDSTFMYGAFINALISFLLVGVALFLFVVKPYNAYLARRRAGQEPTTKVCPECTSEIAAGARRCPQCTAQLSTA